MSNPKPIIHIMTPGEQFYFPYFLSYIGLYNHLHELGYQPFFHSKQGAYLQHDRGEMLLGKSGQPRRGMLPFEGVIAEDNYGVKWDLSDYTHILWIDNDMSFTASGFDKLMSRDLDIVGGLYRRSDEFMCYMEFEGDDARPATWEDVKGKTEPIEAFSIGFGFTLIKKGVFEGIAKSDLSWFLRYITEPDGRPLGLFGEDVAFGFNARECGFKSYVDPTVHCGHYKRKLLFPSDFDKE